MVNRTKQLTNRMNEQNRTKKFEWNETEETDDRYTHNRHYNANNLINTQNYYSSIVAVIYN